MNIGKWEESFCKSMSFELRLHFFQEKECARCCKLLFIDLFCYVFPFGCEYVCLPDGERPINYVCDHFNINRNPYTPRKRQFVRQNSTNDRPNNWLIYRKSPIVQFQDFSLSSLFRHLLCLFGIFVLFCFAFAPFIHLFSF